MNMHTNVLQMLGLNVGCYVRFTTVVLFEHSMEA